ncbi:MAG: hypothetical protein ACN6N2_02350 [Acinetobacter calcoaceticus]
MNEHNSIIQFYEFPRLDERLVWKLYRFAYSISVGDEGESWARTPSYY